MPDLDPARYPFARLRDASHRLPFGARLFGANADHPGFERVDLFDGTINMLIADGSIEIVADPRKKPSKPAAAAADTKET